MAAIDDALRAQADRIMDEARRMQPVSPRRHPGRLRHDGHPVVLGTVVAVREESR